MSRMILKHPKIAGLRPAVFIKNPVFSLFFQKNPFFSLFFRKNPFFFRGTGDGGGGVYNLIFTKFSGFYPYAWEHNFGIPKLIYTTFKTLSKVVVVDVRKVPLIC